MLASRKFTVIFALTLAVSGGAQTTNAELQWVNGEWERYWRVLQVGGDVPLHPWSSRPFGPEELSRLHPLGDHPWADRVEEKAFRIGGITGAAVPVDARTIFNSSFPYGFNEGPMWAGRGVTVAVRGGATFSYGVLSAALTPLLFDAQNVPFSMMANGYAGRFAFGFPYPWGADMPQRFGDRTYARLDPGNSFVRADVGPVAAGFSTQAQHWGPARDHPLILGSNAGGFPHVFVGTARPTRAGPIRVHAKMMWGKLYQSRYTFMDTINRHRLAAGALIVISPVAIPGLELGGGRFDHMLWTDDVFSHRNLLRPFQKFLGQEGGNPENELASVFARWVFPRAGVEAYGEFAREDAALSFRHLLAEPDHDAGYMLGLQRVLGGGGGRGSAEDTTGQSAARPTRSVVRFEILNTRGTNPHLAAPQSPFYVHSPIAQGHTYLGMALGSAGGFGGGAATAAFDRYTPRGRWSVTWTRLMRAEYLTSGNGWVPEASKADVFHALGVDGILFRGRTAITYELTGVYELNRNFARDAFNLRAASGVRYAW